MIKKTNNEIASLPVVARNDRRGQTALILILLTAAALIFLAIALNWGNIAQTKALITVAADEGAALLASGPASYGEMEKETNLKDTNQVVAHTSVFLAILMVVVAIIVAVIAWWGPGEVFALALVSVAMAIVSLVLQVAVVQPGITSLWNKLQQNQPVQQQFFEQGISTALQGSVTDQGAITDYLDSNANGVFGLNAAGFPKDTIGRFAFFYNDRLKMLNQGLIPQVVFFYNQLGEFMNGESCAQNENDAFTYPAIFSVNPSCLLINPSPIHCIGAPTDPACQEKIPNGFQLNDPCGDSNPTVLTYNPYCDPCCQPLTDPTGKPLRPLPPNSNCTTDTSAYGAPAQCWDNNPFNFSGPSSSLFTLLYDPSYQEYAKQISFLDQFGRDQQVPPMTTALIPLGAFPNGIYPYFWLMKDYSPEVDDINPLVSVLAPSQYHWCSTAVAPLFTPPTGYTTLTQLGSPPYGLTFACVGADCCVNYVGPAAGPIDLVGSPAFPYSPPLYNPAFDPSFGENGTVPPAPWLEGDNQLCSSTWPYNGENPALYPDGTCEWTGSTAAPPAYPPPPAPVVIGESSVDGLDDVMHTLTDFTTYSYTILGNDVGTLSSSFDSWYPQLADWTDPNYNGRLLNIYNPPGDVMPPVNVLGAWGNVIGSWLDISYTAPTATSATVWCVPTETALLGGHPSTLEDAYINSASGTATWGDINHVLACLNYNAAPATAGYGTVYNYQQCQAWVTPGAPGCCDDGSTCTAGVCGDGTSCPVTLTGTPCDPSSLGRSLIGPAPAFDGCAGAYKAWVTNSLTEAMNESPKFALRSAFLTDIYNRAQTMLKIFSQGQAALSTFLKPCASTDATCQSGGPAAQLAYAYGLDQSGNSSVASLPNAVIYGWQDNLPPGGGGCTNSAGSKVGCAHLVKVTAYSVGRAGLSTGINTLLPWIQTKTSGFLSTTRSFTLEQRDGYAYLSVKRWDQDHNPLSFPNGHTLWQSMFHNPASPASAGGASGLSSACIGLNGGGGSIDGIGFGLTSNTVNGLNFSNYSTSQPDVVALGQAFMLNDEGQGPNAGKVDPNAISGSTYLGCLQWANSMLCSGQESHACVEFIASSPASDSSSVISGSSQNGDQDYSLKFVDCGSIAASFPDDLTGERGAPHENIKHESVLRH